jgi:hypothetical protein
MKSFQIKIVGKTPYIEWMIRNLRIGGCIIIHHIEYLSFPGYGVLRDRHKQMSLDAK